MKIYIFLLLYLLSLCYNSIAQCNERGDFLGIMTAKEASEIWGVSPRRVADYIRAERIKGAYKIGSTWVMPDDTKKPPNYKTGRKVPDKKKSE